MVMRIKALSVSAAMILKVMMTLMTSEHYWFLSVLMLLGRFTKQREGKADFCLVKMVEKYNSHQGWQ